VDLRIELPAGSQVAARRRSGRFALHRTARRLPLKTSVATSHRAGRKRSSSGPAPGCSVERATGDCRAQHGFRHGARRRHRRRGGDQELHGDTRLGEIGGELNVKAPTATSRSSAAQRLADRQDGHGDIRVGRRRRGLAGRRDGFGGTRSRSPKGRAWLDLNTRSATSTTPSTPRSRPLRAPTPSRCARAPPTATSPSARRAASARIGSAA